MSHPEPTPADVRSVMDLSSSIENSTIQAHIDASASEVERINQAGNVSESTLTEIHKYLACHYLTLQNPQNSSMSGPVRSESHRDTNADYLSIAERLDPTGVLESSGKPKASLSVPDSKGIED